MIRRFKVKIEDVEITNISGKTMDPFIRFTLGGDFYVSIA